MKSYLQRLAARAEGVALTPSLVPTGSSNMIPPADTGSFFTEAEHAVARPTEAQRRHAPIVPPLESVQSLEPLPSKRRPRRATALREQALEDASGAETFLAPPKIPVRGAVSTPSDASDAAETKREQQAPDESVTKTNPIDVRQVDTSLGSLLTPTLAPKATEQRAASENKTPVAFASNESAALLEPRRMQAPPVPVPDEPRLVIGQLRVDVVATAPTQTREVVRVVSRADGSDNRSRAASPISKLRFGLGQM